jgi:hypothetical protein
MDPASVNGFPASYSKLMKLMIATVYPVIVLFASTMALSTKFKVSTNGIVIIGGGRRNKNSNR